MLLLSSRVSHAEPRANSNDVKIVKKSTEVDSTEGDGQAILDNSIRQRFRRLKPAECGVGRIVSDVEFRDIDGVSHRLADFKSRQAIVIAVTSTSCPMSKRFLPTLARLEQAYAKNVTFIFVNSTPTDSRDSIRAIIKAHALKGPYVIDSGLVLLNAVGAKSTTDCFVIDAARTLRYRGAADDQYGFGYALAQPKHTLLADALDAVLAGRTPPVEATDAPGCLLNMRKAVTGLVSRGPSTIAADDVGHTYHNRVSRIVQANCVECHRTGGAAPFSLTQPEDVASRSAMIEKVVRAGTMPPWFAAPSGKGAVSRWSNDRSVSEEDKQDLTAWLNKHQPLGDPKDAPIASVFSDEWKFGKPDAVVQLPSPVPVPAEGILPYKHITITTDFDEDKWVQGFEIRPTAKEVVHHVGVFIESGSDPTKEGDKAEDSGAYLALYVPGRSSQLFPAGCAKRLRKGDRLRFRIHYTPNGTATQDQTLLGLIFAKQPPVYELHMRGIVNHNLKIPPNAENHKETVTLQLSSDIQILSFLPHMHVRGKAFRYQAMTDSGVVTTLLDVPRYDFNWQLAYHTAVPLTLRKRTNLVVTGWFDNSSQNPANPDPSATVSWGSQTSDEMLIGYIEYIVPGERLTGKNR